METVLLQPLEGDCENYIDLDELERRNGLQFVHINVRSIFHKISTLRYDFFRDSMDIVGVSETWLKTLVTDELISILGFAILRNDRCYARGGGGGVLVSI